MGGVTQYLDLPSWVAGEMIWALFPWVWWAIRRTMLRGANPLPALLLGYLLVSVGYVFGTIMLVVLLPACLLDCLLARDRRALLRVLVTGVLLGLVAVTVYLPGVLTAPVSARSQVLFFDGKFTTDPITLLAGVLPTTAVSGTTHLLPYAYLAWLLPAVVWIDWRRLRAVATARRPARSPWSRWSWSTGRPARGAAVAAAAPAVPGRRARRRAGRALVAARARAPRRRLAFSLVWVLLVAGVRGPPDSSGAPAWSRSRWWRWARAALVAVPRGAGRLGRAGGRAGDRRGARAAARRLPDPPSPQRKPPTRLATYQHAIDGAVGDVMQVGDADAPSEPARGRPHLLIGSGWYLSGARCRTPTPRSATTYKDRYCIYYQGDTCPEALDTLFSIEPTTGMPRVDLLGVSSLLLVRRDSGRAGVASRRRVAGRPRTAVRRALDAS